MNNVRRYLTVNVGISQPIRVNSAYYVISSGRKGGVNLSESAIVKCPHCDKEYFCIITSKVVIVGSTMDLK